MTAPSVKNQAVEPLVSVCVPTYNDGAYLRQCLCSIIDQTYRNLEILVGDDCSADDTRIIVQSLNDPRIQYIRNEKNLGQFPNVNSLVRRAAGEYIAIYHSDDIYHPEIIAKEVTFLRAEPQVGALFALDWRIDSDGNRIGKMRLLPEIPSRTALGFAELMPVLLRHRNRIFRAPTFMGRKEIFGQVGYFSSEFDIAGDFEMWLRIMTRYKVAVLDEWLMYYRRGKSQVSHSYQKLRTVEEHYFEIMDHYLEVSGLHGAIDRVAMTEYAFHRCDDETFRAANFLIKGDAAAAGALLRRPYPWRTLTISTADLHWRKIRVLLVRGLLRIGLALKLTGPLGRLLAWTEYRGRH